MTWKTWCGALCAAVLAMGCGAAVNGDYRGPPLVTLGGQLTLKEGLTVGGGVRLAIAWYPNLAGDNPTPPKAIATEEVSYTGSFPQNFTFRLYGPPAAAALERVEREDGTIGEAAVGQLLAYEDLDGDGKLTVDATGRSADRILGSTAGAGPFDFFSSAQRDIVAWVSDADDLGLKVQGMKAGYNLLRFTSPFEPPAVLPLDTPIPLALTGDPRLALIVCPEAYADPDAQVACGVTIWNTPEVMGNLAWQADGSMNAFFLVKVGGEQTTQARITVNGVEVPLDQGATSYSLLEATPSAMRPGLNTVVIEAPGYSAMTMQVRVPGDFSITSPVGGTQVAPGATLAVAWTASTDATGYAASMFVDGPGPGSDTELTTSLTTSITVPPTTGRGELSVTAFERLDFSRSSVTGITTRSVVLTVAN